MPTPDQTRRVHGIWSATSIGVFLLFLTWGATGSLASSFTFYSTTTPSAWSVSVASGPENPNNDPSYFNTSGPFTPAVAVTGRPDYIADNASGSHGGIGNWTYFLFSQTFSLAGFDPATADLQFQWAADDIGGGSALRGYWFPVFRLNGGPLTNGGVPVGYDYGNTVRLTSGFVAGLNTISFYVEGNGQTDGFKLRLVSATADPGGSAVPEPATLILLSASLVTAAARRRFTKRT